MRILYLASHLPGPPCSGGRRRAYELTRRLSSRAEVHLCAVSKTFREDLRYLPKLKQHCGHVDLFPAGTSRAPNPDVPAQVDRHASPAAAEFVAAMVREGRLDSIHVEGYYLMQHVPRPCPVPVMLVEHNIEQSLWKQRAGLAADREMRSGLLEEARRIRDCALECWRRADLCGVLTEEDRCAMLAEDPALDVRMVPDGADHSLGLEASTDQPPIDCPGSGPLIVLVGNFAYEPSADAARHLCEDILPTLRRRIPSVRAMLVGNGPPNDLLELAETCPALTVTGRVPDVGPYLEAADVVVCPLRIGGGVKVKMLEALARAKPIVASGIAMQGLNGYGHAVVRADDPNRFAQEVAMLLSNPRRRAELTRAARRVAEDLPSWDQAATALADCHRELLEGRANRRPGPRLMAAAAPAPG